MKVTKKDYLGSLGNVQLSADEKAFLEKNAEPVVEVINKALEGTVSADEVEAKFKSLSDKLSAAEGENAQLKKQNDELCEAVKSVTAEIEKAKTRGGSILSNAKFFDQFDSMMSSQKMKNFIDGVDKTTGSFSGFSVKDIQGITAAGELNNSAAFTTSTGVIANPFSAPKLSLRDVIRTVQGDSATPSFEYLRVKNFDRNANFVAENGRLSRSNIEFESVMTSVKRIGSYFDISRNLLLARIQMRAFLLANIPGIVTQAENAGILFGDGKANYLQGIATYEGVGSIEDQITGTIVDVKAKGIKSVESYNGGKGVIVKFAEALPKALSSMMATFAGAAVNTALNGTHPLVKVNDTTYIVDGAAYVGEETALESMTCKINHASYKKIAAPDSGDVFAAMVACMSFAQYTPNAIVLNPTTVFAIETEKDTTGRKLDIVKAVGNQKYIAGLPVIECNEVPVGKYFIGDFQNGANLYDYTNLELNWVEDAETAVMNMVRLVFQEQLALVVYMPWAFAYGSLDALKAAITKA